MNTIRLANSRPVARALVIALMWYGALWLVSQDMFIHTDEIEFAQVTCDTQVWSFRALCDAEQIVGSYLIYSRTGTTCVVTAKR